MIKAAAKLVFHAVNWARIHDNLLLTPYEKRDRVEYFARRFGARNFVETGSYHGDTSKHVAPLVEQVLTIEIDARNAEVARSNLSEHHHAMVLCGASESVLPGALAKISGKTLFWLDAHYQVGMTRGRTDCPLFQELDTIFSNAQIEPLILIDDARKFIWVNGWPSLASVRRYVEARGYSFRVSDDMICVGRFSM